MSGKEKATEGKTLKKKMKKEKTKEKKTKSGTCGINHKNLTKRR